MVCGRKSMVLLFYCSASHYSIVLLSGGLLSRNTRRKHTRLLFDSVGCLDRQDCVYKHVVARS